jgi:RNA polymerase sigma-70 factor (ECF subfamily)
LLDPNRLPDYIDLLYRAAWALCGSRHDAEDLVQETFATVLKRPRLLRTDNDIGYLLRALRNTYATRYRIAARRPATRQLFEDDAPPVDESRINAREIMQAIASAPAPYRDAVIAVDLLGLSYREAARSLHTREATITTRLHRGRQHVAGELIALPERKIRAGSMPTHRRERPAAGPRSAASGASRGVGESGCSQASQTSKSMSGNETEEECA